MKSAWARIRTHTFSGTSSCKALTTRLPNYILLWCCSSFRFCRSICLITIVNVSLKLQLELAQRTRANELTREMKNKVNREKKQLESKCNKSCVCGTSRLVLGQASRNPMAWARSGIPSLSGP